MQLARAEGGRRQAAEPTDLIIILRMVAGEMTRLTEGAGRIELVLPGGTVWSRIDPDAFAIVARNLIENALKHGAPGAPVHVALSVDGVLRVVNEGPAVPPELLARLSEPFEGGRTRATGAGLGLAIAQAIASGTGGRIELASPPEGRQQGFEVRFIIGT